jgi:hypothetical protein
LGEKAYRPQVRQSLRSVEGGLPDTSKLVLSWTCANLLPVEIWKPGCRRDGQGWWPQSSALLDGQPWQEVGVLFLSGRERAGAYHAVGEQ